MKAERGERREDKQMRVFGNNIKHSDQIISNDTEINLYDFTLLSSRTNR